MAEARRFACSSCRHSVTAWSDGNPYVLDGGVKRYVYHPDHEALARAVGNDSPAMCARCGRQTVQDSAAPPHPCTRCRSLEFVDLFDLDGRPCPRCRVGTYRQDPAFFLIS